MTHCRECRFIPVRYSLSPCLCLQRYRLRRQRQRFLAQRIEQHAGQVALAEARQHHHDQLARILGPRGYLERRNHGRARRDADKQALLRAAAGAPSAMDSSLVTWMTSSMSLVSRMLGTKPAPMPWILCGPGLPPESTGLSVGSTAMALNSGFLRLDVAARRR